MTSDDATSYYIRTHFGGRGARPVVLQLYAGADGWVPAPTRERLTAELAQRYLDRGIVMVRARARFRTVEVILSNYLGKKTAAPTVLLEARE